MFARDDPPRRSLVGRANRKPNRNTASKAWTRRMTSDKAQAGRRSRTGVGRGRLAYVGAPPVALLTATHAQERLACTLPDVALPTLHGH
jgi:hypothetical protein